MYAPRADEMMDWPVEIRGGAITTCDMDAVDCAVAAITKNPVGFVWPEPDPPVEEVAKSRRSVLGWIRSIV